MFQFLRYACGQTVTHIAVISAAPSMTLSINSVLRRVCPPMCSGWSVYIQHIAQTCSSTGYLVQTFTMLFFFPRIQSNEHIVYHVLQKLLPNNANQHIHW